MNRERAIDFVALVTGPFAILVPILLVYLLVTNLVLFVVAATWVAVDGTIGALIAPGKGLTPRRGFILAGIFGIFGVAYIALRDDQSDGEVSAAAPTSAAPARATTAMFCRKCGRRMSLDSAFCPGCGTAVEMPR